MTATNRISPRRKDAPSSCRPSPQDTHLSLAIISAGSTGRSELEAAIAQKFERIYGARLSHFLPQLMRVEVSGKVGAVVGICPASNNELFLERYLDRPVEQAIAAQFGTPIDRMQVVEIGNLASDIPGLACSLFAVLACVLSLSGFRWVACTATPQVERMLGKLGLASMSVCPANPEQLAGGSVDWGDYYASQPRVIVGDAHEAARRVTANPEFAAMLRGLQFPIEQMVTELRSAVA